MGKNKQKKKPENGKHEIDVQKFALLNAIDLKVMMDEMAGKWEPEKHSDIENHFHYMAKVMGR